MLSGEANQSPEPRGMAGERRSFGRTCAPAIAARREAPPNLTEPRSDLVNGPQITPEVPPASSARQRSFATPGMAAERRTRPSIVDSLGNDVEERRHGETVGIGIRGQLAPERT